MWKHLFVLTLSNFLPAMALPAPTTPLPTLLTPYLDHRAQYYQWPLTTSSTWRCQNSTCAIIGKLSCTQALPSPHAGTTLRAYRNRIYDIRSAPHANRVPRRPPHDTFVVMIHFLLWATQSSNGGLKPPGFQGTSRACLLWRSKISRVSKLSSSNVSEI